MLNYQKFAEAYAVGLYDVNRLRDRWNRDFSPDELMIDRENVSVIDGPSGNSVRNIFKYNSENNGGDERTYIGKYGDDIVS